MTTLTMVEAVRSALMTEMERDDRVMVLGEDVGKLGGVYRATEGLIERFGPDRVFDTPIAEASIIGASVGLAASGVIPVAELQFLGFGHLAFHQVAHQLARLRYRSRGKLTAPVTIRAPFGGGVRALEIHSDAYESMYANVPGLKVVAPATAHDAKGMLLASIRDEDPVLFLEPLRGYRLIKDEVPDGDYTVELGKARIAREGNDITLIAWSGMVPQAERAADTLASEGISAEVIDLRSITPLDVDTLATSVAKTGRAVIIQEGPLSSGFAAEVATTIAEEVFYSLEAPVQRVAGPDTPYPFAAALEDFYLPGQSRILGAARKALSA
ncbi:pyruvate dehydrogenase E1 component beta subunit [Arthrobacter sp. SLBN-100]|uniref:alpha-ketoacid dehydrogenase subunit beta n=1 Tax=Arthrobacter sp. SLBN-100 TaxID=2768450 RepID=UPI00114E46F5|nr:alpha-ketoacid dehydrogenase subunit beta [Arthrobacter sp. SLBN-100]TQJ62220.1 pyruvate dehydrogenase E1 component beta subunit [Arthrobacter sp. SLBN-100]